MNTQEVDLDLDGWQAMVRAERREQEWRRAQATRSFAMPALLEQPRERSRGRPSRDPAWD